MDFALVQVRVGPSEGEAVSKQNKKDAIEEGIRGHLYRVTVPNTCRKGC